MPAVKMTVYRGKDGKATLDRNAGPVLFVAGAIVSGEQAVEHDLESAYKEQVVLKATSAEPSAPPIAADHYGKAGVTHREKAPAKTATKAPTKTAKETE